MSDRTDREIYQKIAALVTGCAPLGWEIVWLEAEIGNDTGRTLFYWSPAGGERAWFAPATRIQYEFYQLFQELREVMAARQSAEKWTKATLTIRRNGKFSSNFGYAAGN